MSVSLTLKCDGCSATTEPVRVRREFISINGKGYGFGSWHVPRVDEVECADGWVMFDPYTSCTYCPTCWQTIEADSETDSSIPSTDGESRA